MLLLGSSALAGFFARRWQYGLLVASILLVAFWRFVIVFPMLAYNAPLNVPSIDSIWRETIGLFLVLLATFAFAHIFRRLVGRLWLRKQSE